MFKLLRPIGELSLVNFVVMTRGFQAVKYFSRGDLVFNFKMGRKLFSYRWSCIVLPGVRESEPF